MRGRRFARVRRRSSSICQRRSHQRLLSSGSRFRCKFRSPSLHRLLLFFLLCCRFGRRLGRLYRFYRRLRCFGKDHLTMVRHRHGRVDTLAHGSIAQLLPFTRCRTFQGGRRSCRPGGRPRGLDNPEMRLQEMLDKLACPGCERARGRARTIPCVQALAVIEE